MCINIIGIVEESYEFKKLVEIKTLDCKYL